MNDKSGSQEFRAQEPGRLDLRPGLIGSAAILAVMIVLSAWTWAKIPAGQKVPVHWNIEGKVDQYGGKAEALLFMPALVAGCIAFLAALPWLEPRRLNITRSRKAYQAIWLAIVVMLGVCHCLMVMGALGITFNMNRIMPALIGAMLIVIGNYFGKLRSNFFAGIRTPWTLSSELSWNKTHRMGGWFMVVLGAALMITAIVGSGPVAVGVVLGGAAAFIVFTMVYSYIVWKGDPNKQAVGRG